MGLKEKLDERFKEALKQKDTLAVSTLRMLKAAIQNREIEKRGQALDDGEVIKIIAKQAEQHEDSISQFTNGRRFDLVEKEKKELAILKNYLPEQLSEEEVAKVIKKIITDTGAKDKNDLGKVMKMVMPELKGRADGKLVNRIVNTLLGLDKK